MSFDGFGILSRNSWGISKISHQIKDRENISIVLYPRLTIFVCHGYVVHRDQVTKDLKLSLQPFRHVSPMAFLRRLADLAVRVKSFMIKTMLDRVRQIRQSI